MREKNCHNLYTSSPHSLRVEKEDRNWNYNVTVKVLHFIPIAFLLAYVRFAHCLATLDFYNLTQSSLENGLN